MRRQLYIDGIDIYDAYGVFFDKDSYKSLMSYPALKAPDFTDWLDEDGEDVDLHTPALDSREFILSFFAHNMPLTGDFITQLSDNGYHEFRFAHIGRTYKLRLANMPNKKLLRDAESFSLQFADDFPLYGYKYSLPEKVSGVFTSGYELDGRDLSEYGVAILKDSLAEVEKMPTVKANEIANLKSLHGVIHDDSELVFNAKDVSLNLYIQATTIDHFWRNYDALLYDLIQPHERSLYCDKTEDTYSCYYKSSNIKSLIISKGVWCIFTLTLRFTSFRIGDYEYLLAGEDNYLIIDEENENYIDMK